MPLVDTLAASLGDLIVHEQPYDLSRQTVTVLGGVGNLALGTVLGKVTASGKYKPCDPTAADGSAVAAAIVVGDVSVGATDIAQAVLTRSAAVRADELVYAGTWTGAQKTAAHGQLDTLAIRVLKQA